MGTIDIDFTAYEDRKNWGLTCPNEAWHEEHEDEVTDEECPCGCEDGDINPMFNYVYPVDSDYHCNQDMQIQVLKETSCCLLENEETGKWVIGLMRGGQDMSYSLAYTFYLVQKWMPTDFLEKLSSRRDWASQHLDKEKFEKLRSVVEEQCGIEIRTLKRLEKEWA